jgi:HK97 gp10 family phage protein
MADLRLEGSEAVLARIEEMADTAGIESAMGRACALVERAAKTAPKPRKRTGALRNSIQSRVEKDGQEIKGIVFTNLEYAPYVEFGTGLFAEAGNGRKTPWTYEDEATGERIFTRGQRPQPFLRPALYNNKEKITQMLKEGLND